MNFYSILLTCVILTFDGVISNPIKSEHNEDIFFPEQNCVHKFPAVDDIPHPVFLEHSPGHRSKRSMEHQLRIKVFYHESVEKLKKRERSIVKDQVVPGAVSFWTSVLKVRRNTGKIHLNRKCENNQYFLAPDDPTQYCKNKCVETKCGEFKVPESHLKSCHTCDRNGRNCKKEVDDGEGVEDVDFVLYVSALPTSQCGESIGEQASTVAYAAHCQQESSYDRPIAGHTNICPSAIRSTEVGGLTSTVKHELLHALGFSSSLFAFFRDKDGEPLTPRGDDGKPPINRKLQVRQWSDNIIRQAERPWKVRSGTLKRTVSMMVTPKVVEEVRRHFGCPELEGAELEDQGGDGTSLTHWEKRIFQNEAMTGTVHTKNPVYSRLTFALLEDSGWYLPNYELAEEIQWGRNLGCDFALRSCMELIDMNREAEEPKYPFCDTVMQSSSRTFCTFDSRAVGSCNLVQFGSEIPKMYQNFKELKGVEKRNIGRVGSSVTLADFCPYIQEFTWKSTGQSEERGTRCAEENNSPVGDNNYALEKYGRGARCFEQGGKWEQKSCRTLKQWKRYGAGCYPYECTDGGLNIVVRNVSLPCEKAGQVIDIRLKQGKWLHEGSVVCPDCNEICDVCEPRKSSRVDPDALMDDVANTCFQEAGTNGINKFLSSFGLGGLAN